MNIIPMRCENCGGTLEMSDVSDVWVCPFCGTKNVLSRSSENETTEKRVEGMQKIVYQALSAANTEKA